MSLIPGGGLTIALTQIAPTGRRGGGHGHTAPAPKLRALHDGIAVALTIDSDEFPYKVLSIRRRTGELATLRFRLG